MQFSPNIANVTNSMNNLITAIYALIEFEINKEKIGPKNNQLNYF